jgi:hypothetical protein
MYVPIVSIPKPSKMDQNQDFWYDFKSSGNPASLRIFYDENKGFFSAGIAYVSAILHYRAVLRIRSRFYESV